MNNADVLAVLRLDGINEKVHLTDISAQGCTAIVDFEVGRDKTIALQLFEDKGDGQFGTYSPITSSIASVTKRRTAEGERYEIRIKFNISPTPSHGVEQAIKSQNLINFKHKETVLTGNNPSLEIIPVTCYLCGQKDIPFRVLDKRAMVASTNIFGIQEYREAHSGKTFCNYNLVKVAVCPTCYFASSSAKDFKRESLLKRQIIAPFRKVDIFDQWMAGTAQRKAMLGSTQEQFFSDKRNLHQALVSYDLAIITTEAILAVEQQKQERARNYRISLKIIQYLLIKAELLMANGKAAEAQDILKQTMNRIGEYFPFLQKEASIKAAYLRGMLGLYVEDARVVGETMQFLQNYKRNNNVLPGTDEATALKINLNKFSNACQSREEFSKSKLKGFQKPFEF